MLKYQLLLDIWMREFNQWWQTFMNSKRGLLLNGFSTNVRNVCPYIKVTMPVVARLTMPCILEQRKYAIHSESFFFFSGGNLVLLLPFSCSVLLLFLFCFLLLIYIPQWGSPCCFFFFKKNDIQHCGNYSVENPIHLIY